VITVTDGAPEQILEDVKRICESRVTDGGKFVMIVANNLASRTPVENIRVLYESTKEFGRYD